MKRKHLFGLVAVVAVVGLASSAQAGVSVHFSFGLPAPVFHAPRSVVVFQPCPPPVVYCPPVVVYQPVPRCEPVVYVAPRYERHYDYRDHRGPRGNAYGHNKHKSGRDDHGPHRGGRR